MGMRVWEKRANHKGHPDQAFTLEGGGCGKEMTMNLEAPSDPPLDTCASPSYLVALDAGRAAITLRDYHSTAQDAWPS